MNASTTGRTVVFGKKFVNINKLKTQTQISFLEKLIMLFARSRKITSREYNRFNGEITEVSIWVKKVFDHFIVYKEQFRVIREGV